ncbi:uncharacterized protein LOC128227679 isoform X2 [Mya arenaria]|uniref:uncharacterized protein LOC128227679 isoform X2 n=1 Tax=Mya arenaria TaxID=6604 RepID=UPI0022E1EE53|nr:uncharacterized protein LOC128227679 isoform X2 [Mya arenaria]
MDPTERGRKLLDAINKGDEKKVVELVINGKSFHKVDFNVIDRGDNAVHLAARKGMLDVLKLLAKIGADLAQRNIDGDSPLHRAIGSQPMDIIETLVDVGMDPNLQNSVTGDTPLHVAMKLGSQEAMEALLIKGARSAVLNNEEKKPEHVARTSTIKDSLRMYDSLAIAYKTGGIKAQGTRVTRKEVENGIFLDRVNVIIAHMDIPEASYTYLYCRSERVENSTIKVPNFLEEFPLSDVYNFKIFNVNKECNSVLFLPLYQPPSKKEQMILRFIDSSYEDMVIDEYVSDQKSVYCPLEIALTPETMYYCIVFVRPRIEEHEISENETKITSDMEKDFVMDIQGETFDTDTALKLQVFESQDPNNSDKYEMDMSEDEEVSPEAEMKQRQDDQILVSDVFQINVSGNQPKKPVTVQIPMCKGMKAGDDIVIVSGNEQDLARENALEVLPFKPKVVNTSLIFEVSHFSMFTATWRKWDVDKVKEELLNVKEKRKPVSFYAVVQKDEEDATGLGHKLIVDCCLANRSQKTRNKWLDQGYEEQNPPETGEMMTVLGDTFTIDVVGNASFEEPSADSDRKIQFWICRSCEQGYNVRLHVGIFEQEEAYGHVVIYKISGDSKTEVARLRILLEPPQKPNDKQTEPQPGKQAKKAIRKPKPPKKSKEKKEKETPRRASNASTSSSLWEWFNKREHRPPSAVMEPVKK